MQTRTVHAPGATITYDVRGDLTGATPQRPPLMMVGSPMDSGGFTTLATYFTDRPVVTYDPRGVGRSERTDDAAESTPEQHAEDIRRVIEALDVGPVDLFASSGGAVNALALVAAHSDLVATLVAHEPPLAAFVPDRQEVLAANRDIGQTYQRSGMGPAMAKFIQLVMVEGPLPASYAHQDDPDPAMFGLPTEDDGSRDDALLGQNIRTCVPYEPHLAELRSASTRIVVAAGVESAQQLTGRAAAGLAAALGRSSLTLPSFPATTPASWAESMANRGSRNGSPPSSTKYWPCPEIPASTPGEAIAHSGASLLAVGCGRAGGAPAPPELDNVRTVGSLPRDDRLR